MDNDSLSSASSLIIKSFNVNSIGKNPKRSNIFNFLKKSGGDIQILIDTRFSKNIENKIKEKWESEAYFSSNTSQSREVAILFKRNLCIETLKVEPDSEGNMLSLLLKFDNKTILLTGLYGPNTDQPLFYKNKVFNLINEWNPDCTVFGGDWNLVLDQNMDTKNYLHNNNILARNELK